MMSWPERTGRTPNTNSISSVRPAPTSPPNPSTSPARTSNEAGSWMPGPLEALGTQAHVADLHALLDEEGRSVAAYHEPNKAVWRGVRDRLRRYPAAVLEHRDAITDLDDLLEIVRDVDDAKAPGGEPAHQREEVLGLALAERRGRFVEHEDRGLEAHGTHDRS